MKGALPDTFKTPEPRATRIRVEDKISESAKQRSSNPPEISDSNDEPLLAEATTLANGFLESFLFHYLLAQYEVDHSTVVEQAKKVIVKFASQVVTRDKDDTRHSWAWTMSECNLTNVQIFINDALKKQVDSFKVAHGSLEWKKYVYMIAVLIFHEFAHLCLRWKGVDSPDVDISEMGTRAEQKTFDSTFRFVFNKKPQEKAKGEWVIDDTIKLTDIVMSNSPKKPLTERYIQDAYNYTVNRQAQQMVTFNLCQVAVEKTDKTFSRESWRSRQIDQLTTKKRPKGSRIDGDTPVIVGWCVKAIQRGLTKDPDEESDDEDDDADSKDEVESIEDEQQNKQEE